MKSIRQSISEITNIVLGGSSFGDRIRTRKKAAVNVVTAVIVIALIVFAVPVIFSSDDDKKSDASKGTEQKNISDVVSDLHLIKYAEKAPDYSTLREYVAADINNSIIISDGSTDEEFKQELYLIIDQSVYREDERINSTVSGFNAEVYPLIVDSYLGNPDYLSRARAVKVTVVSQDGIDMLSETLMNYERASTDIARELYTSKYGKDIGTVSIIFNNPSGKLIAGMTLDAADADKYTRGKIWNNKSRYIRSDGWSRLELNKASELTAYETRDDSVTYESNKARADTVQKEGTIDNSAYFLSTMTQIYPQITSGMNTINTYAKSGDLKKILSSSAALLRDLHDFKDSVEEIRVSSELLPKKVGVMESLDNLTFSVSDLWYAVVSSDAEKLTEAAVSEKNDLEILNGIMESLDMGSYDADDIITEQNYQIANAMSFMEVFNYKDNSKSNDISAKPRDWKVKTVLNIKNIRTGAEQVLESGYDKEYVLVTMRIVHMGFRGGSSTRVTAPSPSSYTLYYKGYEYKPVTISGYMENVGTPYSAAALGRRETYDGIITFLVSKGYPPESFDGSKAYLKLNLGGEYGTAVWSLDKPGSIYELIDIIEEDETDIVENETYEILHASRAPEDDNHVYRDQTVEVYSSLEMGEDEPEQTPEPEPTHEILHAVRPPDY